MKILTAKNPSYSGIKELSVEISWNKIKRTDKVSNDAIMLASAADLTFRTLNMPFGDKKRCKELVKEDLEYSLAFPIKETSWDFIINPEGNALALAIPLSRMDKFKEATIIDTEITALSRACVWCGHSDAIIIDAGASKTCAIGIKNGFPENATVFFSGGNSVNEKIARKNNISLIEAEELKLSEGFNNDIFKREAEKIFQTVKERIKGKYSEIILTGGMFLADDSIKKASEFFNLKTSVLNLPDGFSPYFDVALFGAFVIDKYPALSINLKEQKETSKELPLTYIFALIIPMILIASHIINEEIYWKNRARSFSNAIKHEISKDFPNKKLVKPIEQLSQEIRKYRRNMSGVNEKYLEFLSDIGNASSTINNKNALNIYDISLSQKDASFSGEADSLSDAEKIREELSKKYPDSKITEGKTLQSKKIKFTIKLSLSKKSKITGGKKN